LLKSVRRRVSWESDVDTLLKAEFRTRDGSPDLAVSVYEVTAQQVLQTVVEHSAGAGLDPPRGGVGVDLEAGRETVTTAGETLRDPLDFAA